MTPAIPADSPVDPGAVAGSGVPRADADGRPPAPPWLEGLCAALLPPEHGGPDPVRLAALVDGYLHQLPPPARWGILAGAAALDAAARIRGAPLAGLSPDDREGLLEAVARAPGGPEALEALKAVVALVAGADRHAAEMLAAARRHPPARPDAALTVIEGDDWPDRVGVDAVVIGSGAGGAMVARTLARAGWDVVVVEQGRRWGVGEFRSRHPLGRFAGLYVDGGPVLALGAPPVVLPVGRGVGGTTLVNSGTCYRPPAEVTDRWWRTLGVALAEPGRLEPLLDDVETTLQVAPVPMEVMGANGRLALAGAAALGWRARPLDRNAPGCGGCCQCAIGCPRNAKFGVHLNALPQASAAGARIVSRLRVTRIRHAHGTVTGVDAVRDDGTVVGIDAPVVVVAAGALGTPPLLRRSGLGGHPHMGRNLALHPALSVAGRFDHPVRAWEGVLQSAAVEELHDRDRILIEATATPPGMGSMVLPGVGRRLLAEIADAEHHATLGAMIGDGPWGAVHGRGSRTVCTYRLPSEAADRLRRAVRAMAEVLFAAGARRVLPGIPGAGWLDDLDAVDEVLARSDHRRWHLAAFHPTGTARAGADPGIAPVDGTGRLRGATGVWVADASIVPTCPDVNPQVTIMALALAVAEEILAAH